MYRMLMVPLDGSELAERALPYAVRLAKASHGRLILARVATAPTLVAVEGIDVQRIEQAAVDEARQYLDRLAGTVAREVPTEMAVYYGSGSADILQVASQSLVQDQAALAEIARWAW